MIGAINTAATWSVCSTWPLAGRGDCVRDGKQKDGSKTYTPRNQGSTCWSHRSESTCRSGAVANRGKSRKRKGRNDWVRWDVEIFQVFWQTRSSYNCSQIVKTRDYLNGSKPVCRFLLSQKENTCSDSRVLLSQKPVGILFEHLCWAFSWNSFSYHVLGETQKAIQNITSIPKQTDI